MLKYLFAVQYKDGTIYEQNPDDVSATDPKRSCFFDVKIEEAARFLLYEPPQDNPPRYFVVDLINGSFEVNGVVVRMHEDGELLQSDGEALTPAALKLIFFRRHKHRFNVSAEAMKEELHEIAYRFGWEATVNGNHIQRVMEID